MKAAFFSALKEFLVQEPAGAESEMIDLYRILMEKIDHQPPLDESQLLSPPPMDEMMEDGGGKPKTPTEEAAAVKMKTFNVDDLRESIIYSICSQKASLRRKTLKLIAEFLDGDFDDDDTTRKIQLQVFLHYCKVDLDLLYQNSKDNERFGGVAYETRDLCYDEELRCFVDLALEPVESHERIAPSSESHTKFFKDLLQYPALLSAFEVSLNDVLTTTTRDIDSSMEKNREWIVKEIDQMVIYDVFWFGPWGRLRGAALIDGILICSGNLIGHPKSPKYNADMVTLLCHECVHYLARLKFNDLNFSSPWKYLQQEEGIEKRPDTFATTLRLEELGRNVESLLCGGVKPDWELSKNKAAKLFVERMKSKLSYPLIEPDEHEQIGLQRLKWRTRYFGVDVKPSNTSYY